MFRRGILTRSAASCASYSLEGLQQKAFALRAAAAASADVSSVPQHQVINPGNGEIIGSVPHCTYEDTQKAIASAVAAQKEWEKVIPLQRAKVCRNMARLLEAKSLELGQIISLESGKPLKEAIGENNISVVWFDWYAGEAERIQGEVLPPHRPGVRPFVHKKPIGVVGIITPWNHPSAMVTRSLAGAVAAGCSAVLKPSELTPFSAIAISDLMIEAGFPRGLCNVVTGAPAPIGQALMDSSAIRKICFTGSTKTGKALMEQSVRTVKHCAMELGGNAPFVVFDDADLDLAVDGLIVAKFRGAGQTCISPNRVYVHESVHDQFVEKLVAAIKKQITTGSGLRDGVNMGPVITKTAAEKMIANVQKATELGAKVVLGGGRPEGLTPEELRGGCFVAPTVVVDVNHSTMALPKEEIFGPILPVMKFSTEEEGVHLANDTTAGLASYFYSKCPERMDRVSQGLHYGMIAINEGMLTSPYTPFGGVKESGLGRDGGSKYGISEFLDVVLHLHGRSK